MKDMKANMKGTKLGTLRKQEAVEEGPRGGLGQPGKLGR